MLTQEDLKFIEKNLSFLKELSKKQYCKFDDKDHELRASFCNRYYGGNNGVLSALILYFGLKGWDSNKKARVFTDIEKILKLFLYFDRKLIAHKNDTDHTPLLCLFLTTMRYDKEKIALIFIASGADINELASYPVARQNLRNHFVYKDFFNDDSLVYQIKARFIISVLSYVESLGIERNLKRHRYSRNLNLISIHSVKKQCFLEIINRCYSFIFDERISSNLIMQINDNLKLSCCGDFLSLLTKSEELLFEPDSFRNIARFLLNEGVKIGLLSKECDISYFVDKELIKTLLARGVKLTEKDFVRNEYIRFC